MPNTGIGVKGWRNYSTFALFAGGSQRADRQTSPLVDTYSGNLCVLATDWILAARIPCALARAYNHQDSTSGVDRPFGPGWFWQFDMNLTGSMNGTGNVTWKAADGSEYEFTYSAGIWTAPAGMHDYSLTFNATPTPDRYTLSVGRTNYIFEVNATDSRARLIRIEDSFGNALNIVRVYASSEPTAEIDKIQIEYWNGSSWTQQDIVDFTYSGTLITKLRLIDTLVGSDYLDIHYSYTTIDSASRLTMVEPKFGSTALNMEVKYDYNSSAGLEMTKLYDSLGAQAGTPYHWIVSYASGKVSSVVFPIDSTPTTGTVAYAYATGAPTSWSHASPSAWTKVTDARSNDWFYGQNADGTVKFALDPLWVNSSHESYTEYAYNADLQTTSVKTAKPNAESGQLTTSYYYNSNKKLAAVVDAYGFVSWYKYGTRTPYAGGGTGATTNDVIGVFTPMPNQQAYDNSDHTSSETVPPSLSSPLNVDSFVSWDNGNGWWYYTDASGSPKTIKLVRSTMDYTYTTGTGKLTQLLSCSPENFGDGGNPPTYTLTTASGCSKQEFNATTGDLDKSYTPRQFQDSNLKWTVYTYNQIYGVVAEVEAADSVKNSASKKTKYTYNSTKTRVTKVEQPQDNANQWVETLYDNRLFVIGTKRKDIQSWGIDPIVSVTVYDNNGNTTEQWQALPIALPSLWNGNTASGGYDKVSVLAYDRLNRLTTSTIRVDWTQTHTVADLVSQYFYDANGNRIRSRGPGYDVSGTTNYDYSFVEYDDANRVANAYVSVASTNASLGTVPGGTKFTQYFYDLLGNAKQVREPMYSAGPPEVYASSFTFDWLSRQIRTSQTFTVGINPVVRTTRQHFSASGGVYWSEDGEGYKMYPEQDKDGRLWKMHRGSSGGDNDERTYDADGHVLYYYSFKDVVTDSKTFRTRNAYDEMGRLVNSGREQYTGGSWQNWNSNTADTTFNYNGAVLKTYDKVNSGKFSEQVYDNWGQVTASKAPEVPNPAGGGNIVYEQQFTYDVLGRRLRYYDHEGSIAGTPYYTSYLYDVLGRTIRVVDPLNFTTSTYFDARGFKLKTVTPRGAEYISTYDARGLLTRTRVTHDSVDDDTTYSYDDNGRLTQTDYPDGGIMKLEYDQLGRKTKSRSLLSGTDYLDTTYEYDLDNRMTKLTLPGGYDYDYIFDDLGNMVSSTDAALDSTTYTYDLDNRRLVTTQPNGLISTNTYDWKTGGISSVNQEVSASSGDDILTQYSFDNNGRPTTITDGRGNAWVKAYDAMGRMVSLTTPNPGGGAFTQTLTLNGNGSIIKTQDFKTTLHYYQYDKLNRMLGHGATTGANDETYTWNCCNSLSGYTDSFGTAVLTYDDLGRMLSHTDSVGSQIEYEYDSMSRAVKLTPPQGANYRTEYQYNKNGSLSKAKVYDGGSAADTDYVYDTASGQLTARHFPTVSSQYIKTAYTYDSAGRLEYETVTRESGGTTNLYRTHYLYSNLSYGKQTVRTEQNYSGGSWVNSAKLTYETTALGWQNYEQRHEWSGGSWVSQYDITQTYDKVGNRATFHKNTVSAATYGRDVNLSYAYDVLNRPTSMTDSDQSIYSATFTCDANGNITELREKTTQLQPPPAPPIVWDLYNYYDLDDLNRVTANRVKYYDGSQWKWVKRAHEYSATGAILKSTYKTWNDGSSEPAGDALLHSWGQDGRAVQNTDTAGTSFGAVWHWAGSGAGPLKSPNADTASQTGYNLSAGGGAGTPVRRSFLNPTTEGDQRNLWGQGQPNAKDSISAWATGTTTTVGLFPGTPVESRFDFKGSVAPTDLSRATDAREKGRVGVFGSGYSLAGSSPRMTSETIGRDINPLGRGDGMALVGGMVNLGRIAPVLPRSNAQGGQGSSVNNGCCGDDSPRKAALTQAQATPLYTSDIWNADPWRGRMPWPKYERCYLKCIAETGADDWVYLPGRVGRRYDDCMRRCMGGEQSLPDVFPWPQLGEKPKRPPIVAGPPQDGGGTVQPPTSPPPAPPPGTPPTGGGSVSLPCLAAVTLLLGIASECKKRFGNCMIADGQAIAQSILNCKLPTPPDWQIENLGCQLCCQKFGIGGAIPCIDICCTKFMQAMTIAWFACCFDPDIFDIW